MSIPPKNLCRISETLWNHELFSAPPDYSEPLHGLTAEHVDTHLRRLRRMPSTGDDTPEKALAGLQKLYEHQRTLLLQAQAESLWLASAPKVVLWNQLRLLLEHLPANPNPSDVRLLDRLTPLLVKDQLIPRAFSPDARISELLEQLATAELILLDRLARTTLKLRRPYLKQLYRIMADALDYNTTADTIRIEPVLAWIKTILPQNSSAAYADVGCSVATGAKNTILAARVLRPEYCGPLHGIDIVSPSPALQSAMLREHRILLYQANTLLHPLPRRYHIILLANVHRHLTRSDQQQLLTHLACSLTEGGHLFINWRFDQRRSPCLFLQRRNQRLELITEHNAI
ncbi:MAG: hypothetical protein PHG65_09355 [Kiritimatiellae bacterium]|nr:hypothetical protein [Kiritimatiellia bacterium]